MDMEKAETLIYTYLCNHANDPTRASHNMCLLNYFTNASSLKRNAWFHGGGLSLVYTNTCTREHRSARTNKEEKQIWRWVLLTHPSEIYRAVNYAVKFHCSVIMWAVINLPSNKRGKPQNITHKLLHITFLSLCQDAHINVQENKQTV